MIGIEDHFCVEEISFKSAALNFEQVKRRLENLGEERIREMDQMGMEIQVISYGNDSPQDFPVEESIHYCRLANDFLHAAVTKHPDRLAGLAALPVGAPEEAAAELKRCVEELGFKGAQICGFSYKQDHKPFDDVFYYPIYEMANELEVPIYFHPEPIADQIKDYYFAGSWNGQVTEIFSKYAYGWHMDVGLADLRLIVAGIFEKYPRLNIISGHWGEFVPAFLERASGLFSGVDTGLTKSVWDTYREHVYVTPSGMFSHSHVKFVKEVVGIDHMIFSSDYPYIFNGEGMKEFINELPLTEDEKEKFLNRNAVKLLKL